MNGAHSMPAEPDGQEPVTIRRATAEDAPVLARLRWRWQTEELHEDGGDRSTFLDFFTAWTVDHLATHLPFIAEAGGRLAGMAWLNLREQVPSPDSLDRRMGVLESL